MGYNYPESEWYKEAYSLLNGRKLEPTFSPRSRLRKILPFGGKKKQKSQPVAKAPVIPNTQPISAAVGASAPIVSQQATFNAGKPVVATAEENIPDLAASVVQAPQPAGIVEADSLQAQTEVASAKKRGFKRFIPFVGKKD